MLVFCLSLKSDGCPVFYCCAFIFSNIQFFSMDVINRFLKDTLKGGLFFVIPLFVLAMIIGKLWKTMSGFREKFTKLTGIREHVFGVHIGPFITILLIVLLCLIFGLMMRVSYLRNFRNWIDEKLSGIIPGYDLYKTSLEQKISTDKVEGSRPAVLVQIDDAQQAGVIVEEWPDGKRVVFIPSKPGTTEGQVYIVNQSAITYLAKEEVDMNKILKHQGKGLYRLLKTS